LSSLSVPSCPGLDTFNSAQNGRTEATARD
jgi:hypothetical protein